MPQKFMKYREAEEGRQEIFVPRKVYNKIKYHLTCDNK